MFPVSALVRGYDYIGEAAAIQRIDSPGDSDSTRVAPKANSQTYLKGKFTDLLHSSVECRSFHYISGL